jgi:hypothetical protein
MAPLHRFPFTIVRHFAGLDAWRTAPPRRRLLIGVGLLVSIVLLVAVLVGAVSAGLLVHWFGGSESMYDDARP